MYVRVFIVNGPAWGFGNVLYFFSVTSLLFYFNPICRVTLYDNYYTWYKFEKLFNVARALIIIYKVTTIVANFLLENFTYV